MPIQENEVNKVLILGNGFDLAMGLPTQYTDFMEFLRIENIIQIIEKKQKGEEVEERYKKFFGEAERIDLNEIKRLKELQQKNIWAHYFLSCMQIPVNLNAVSEIS